MANQISSNTNSKKTIAVICGGGDLPLEIAQEAKLKNIPLLLIGIVGEADDSIKGFNHRFLSWGQLGKLFELLGQYDIKELVFAGSINRRPEYLKLRPDWTTILTIPKILRSMVGGDNTVIGNIVRIFEDKGIKIIGVQDVTSGILAKKGLMAGNRPSKACLKNIATGTSACKTIGSLDIGQAVICENNRIVAVEGAEGTDLMIERVSYLREIGRLSADGKSGVLVKMLKPGQDERVDLPTIGPETVKLAHKAKLKGVVVDAGRSIILQREECLKLARELKIFIYGINGDEGIESIVS